MYELLVFFQVSWAMNMVRTLIFDIIWWSLKTHIELRSSDIGRQTKIGRRMNTSEWTNIFHVNHHDSTGMGNSFLENNLV